MTKWEYHIVEHFGGLFLDKIALLGQQGWELFQVDEVTRVDAYATVRDAQAPPALEHGYKLYLKRPAPEWTPIQREAIEHFLS